ncbi:hypothetical protein IHI24_000427 [Rickettsia endosymbiont of Cardiosporidium cionae]|nr:hypothetical protein IHI24_000427 [Rickettsia endosymbiont of Cardiosporidium cionae]
MVSFVFGIFAKWYIVVVVTAVVVVFWVFKGLETTGILGDIFGKLYSVTSYAKSVARYCTPKIKNLNDFFYCLDNPAVYVESDSEKELNSLINKAISAESINKLLEKQENELSNDPYSN